MTNTKDIYVNYNFNKQSLFNFKVHTVTTTSKNTLASSLTINDEGLIVYDITLDKLQVWNGSNFIDVVPISAGGLAFKGVVPHNQATPSNPQVGDLYVFNSAGSNTWNSTPEDVQVNDQAIYNGTSWSFIQGNLVQATENVLGIVEIASQLETNAGISDTVVITPAKLASYVPPSANNPHIARIYRTVIASLTGGTPFTVTHNLGVENPSDIIVNTYQGNEQIDLNITVVNNNSITVESNVTLSNVTVVIVG